jgi:hypothetical protein
MKNKLLLLAMLIAVTGCTKDAPPYGEFMKCEVARPPDADKYLAANRDTQLVMMGMAYTDQVNKVTQCNLANQIINAKNKGLAE